MLHAQQPSRGLGTVLAVIVAIITLTIATNAVQTITMPNISNISYNLAPGADSADITIPVSDAPVLVLSNCNTSGRRGLAQVTMQRTSVAPLFLEWLGLSSLSGPSIVGDWYPGGTSPHIAWVDYAHQVELRAVTTSAIDVRSLIPAGGVNATGYVKLIW